MTKRWYQVGASTVLFAVTAALTGCGGAYDSSVSGTVTLDGTAVPRGTVAYHPSAGGPAAYASIESDGSYTVRTGRESGLPSGQYQVTVVSNEPSVETKDGRPPAPGKSITPLWYKTKESSGLNFNVESGSNTIDLPLTSTPPAGWTPPRR
jgi:hypothetical protein